MIFSLPPKFLIHFNDGAFVEQLEGNKNYTVQFINNGVIELSSKISRGDWFKTNLRYRIPWCIKIVDQNSCSNGGGGGFNYL